MDIMADGPILRCSGDLDGRSTGELREALHAHLDAREGDVVIDVVAVGAVDLPALRVLAAASSRAAAAGRAMTIRGASASLRRLLHLTGLIRFVRVEREPAGA